jgi:sugar phosphate isomerase/epimerase
MSALREDKLVLCNATLVGGSMEVDAATLKSMLNASAKAGFKGVSLWAFHHLAVVGSGLSDDEVQAMHTDLGLTAPVTEALIGWESGDKDAIDQSCLATLDVAKRYGSETVAAVVMAPTLDSFDAATAGFAHLAARAEERGLKVCVEWLPWTGLADLKSAWKMVQDTGCANTGLVVDTWHWLRQPGGPDVETLRQVPGDRIHVVQIDDAPAEGPSDIGESMTQRLLPGDGDVNFQELFDVLDEIGANPIWGPEIFNLELMKLGHDEMAQRVGDACRKLVR